MNTIIIVSLVVQCITTIALCLALFAVTVILKAETLSEAKNFFKKPKDPMENYEEII